MTDLNEIFDVRGIVSLAVLISLIFATLIRGYTSSNKTDFWSPMTFICLTFLYYTVIGPIFAILSKDTTYRTFELGQYISVSWAAAAVSLLSIQVGFLLKPVKVFTQNTLDVVNLKKSALVLFATGFLMYAYWMGPRLGSLLLILVADVEAATYEEMYGGTFSMYIMQGMAFFVAACCFLFIVFLKGRRRIDFWILLALFFFTFVAYLISGFRFRIVMLFVSLASVYFIVQNKRIKILPWLIAGALFVAAMGLIEQTRSYESGLDFSKAEDKTILDHLATGTNESRIFLASGAAIHNVEEHELFLGFEPVFTAVLMPLPRALFPQKPDGNYISRMNDMVFGIYGGGVAYMQYAEAYMAFGWLGIIVSGLFIGYLCKIFYSNCNKAPDNFAAVVLLALFNAFCYVLISRGYLAQSLTTFFFYILIPFWLILFFNKIIKKR